MAIDQIQVQISIARAGIARAGFGKPLILSHNAPFAERYREYADPSEAVSDGFASDSLEVLALDAFFAQTPKPSRVGVGRCGSTVTQQYTIGILAVRSGHTYRLRLQGEGIADQVVEYTSDADATEAEIAAGLVAAINAVTGADFTAAGAASPITIAAAAPNKWLSVSVVNTADLSIAQTHAAPAGTTLADDLTAIARENSSWYAVHPLYNSKAYVGAVAAWTASNGRLCVFDTNDSEVITSAYVAGASTDVGATLLGLGYSGVMGAYHQRPAAMLACRWMGRWLPTLPGASNPAWKALEGVESSILTSTHKANLDARRLNYYYETAPGLSITWEGRVFSTTYGHIDVRRNTDWLVDEIEKNIAGKFAAAEGIGFDDPGIQVAAGGMIESLELAMRRRVLQAGYTYQIPLAEDVSAADREDRVLTGLTFNGGLLGFVNRVIPIRGSIAR